MNYILIKTTAFSIEFQTIDVMPLPANLASSPPQVDAQLLPDSLRKFTDDARLRNGRLTRVVPTHPLSRTGGEIRAPRYR